MKSVTGYGAVQNGAVIVSQRSRFDSAIADTFEDGERVAVTVEKSTRNLRQNGLYWLWVGIIEKETGNDRRWIHHYNKDTFNRITVSHVKRSGEIEDETFAGDTHDLSVDAFAEFMQRVQMGWAEQGVDLPSPNDEEYIPAPSNLLESRDGTGTTGRSTEMSGVDHHSEGQ
jgi:hypothetical protein